VGSFIVNGQMNGERCGTFASDWRPLGVWCGDDGERAGLGVRFKLIRSWSVNVSDSEHHFVRLCTYLDAFDVSANLISVPIS
jgi:hypothetical protein